MPPDRGDIEFTADDLALLGDDDVGDGGGDKSADAGGAKESDAAKNDPPKEPSAENTPPADQTDDDDESANTLAQGKESPPPKQPKGYWPDDWREKVAEHISAGDKKTYEKELRRLQRIADPSSVYGFYREAEGRLTSGGLIKIPGKDAKPEEIAEYRKALGVPEKPGDYLEAIHLDDGTVIGEADKPMLDGVLDAIHKAGGNQPVVDAIVNWYYKTQEDQAADLDEADDGFRRESEQTLKEELGPAYKRNINAIGPLFAGAPGGADVTNNESLYARLMGGRMADGRIIGDDPDMVRFLIGLAHEVNPAATVTEDGDQSGKTIDAELADIHKLRKDDPKKYWSNPVQARELELITAQQKLRAKA